MRISDWSSDVCSSDLGLRAGLALGWMFVIAAELMGASQGLGFLMIDGHMTGRPAVIIGSLILFALAGKSSDALLEALAPRPLPWQAGFGQPQDARHALARQCRQGVRRARHAARPHPCPPPAQLAQTPPRPARDRLPSPP